MQESETDLEGSLRDLCFLMLPEPPLDRSWNGYTVGTALVQRNGRLVPASPGEPYGARVIGLHPGGWVELDERGTVSFVGVEYLEPPQEQDTPVPEMPPDEIERLGRALRGLGPEMMWEVYMDVGMAVVNVRSIK